MSGGGEEVLRYLSKVGVLIGVIGNVQLGQEQLVIAVLRLRNANGVVKQGEGRRLIASCTCNWPDVTSQLAEEVPILTWVDFSELFLELVSVGHILNLLVTERLVVLAGTNKNHSAC